MTFSCFLHFMFFSVFTITHISTAFSSSSCTNVSYDDHCASIVPQSIPTVRSYNYSVPLLVTNHYTGGNKILGRKPSQNPSFYVMKSLQLKITPNHYKTNADGVYKVEAKLYIRSPYRYNHNDPRNFSYGGSFRPQWPGSITFLLNGFWSESSRNLCMVGSADQDQALNFDAVLKVKFANKNPTILSSYVNGVLESTNSSFDPILIFKFPDLADYSYSLVLTEFDKGFIGDIDLPKNKSLNVEPSRFCSMMSGRYFVFELEYAKECNSSPNCSPLGKNYKFLPSFMSLDLIQCSAEQQKVRYVLKFRNISRGVFNQDFDVDWTLIGEGSWDDRKNRLLIVACRILNYGNNLENAVEDCGIRLSLRYSSTWTIRDDTKIVGQIWTNKTVDDDLGFFKMIKLKSSDENDMVVFPGLRYAYTELDRVKDLCQVRREKEKNNKYPNVHSYDMKFDMFVKNWKGQKFAWGNAVPLSVGNKFYSGNVSLSEAEKEKMKFNPVNISYKIGIRPSRNVKFDDFFPTLSWSMNLRSSVEITAEGVYDAKTGQLCMTGCRKLLSYNVKSSNLTTDCEMLVNLEFAPLDARKGGLINGTIKSTRSKQDPLYFEDMRLISVAFYRTVAKKTIRMDLEIAMVLLSSTLVCLFVGLQLFHVKRNHEVVHCISIFMVVILCLGHMIPLVLNFEAMFSRSNKPVTINSGLWLEANEVIVRLVTMVAFLLQVRLLQLVWTSRQSEMTEKGLWFVEIKAGVVSLSIYILSKLVALIVNWARMRQGHQDYYKKYSFLEDLRSCAGLILDGFLLPQILFNFYRGSVEKALAYPFYIGMSLVRLFPHAYDLYRSYNFTTYHVNRTYYYADPREEFYSRAWDVIIPFVIVTLAVIVFLQQRYGGRCVLPRRFRGEGVYEKVPVDSNE